MRVPIFSDWENEKNFEGEGELLCLRAQGLPFILDEVFPEKEQEVYNYQIWVVNVDNFVTTRKIRYLYQIGRCSSYFERDAFDDLKFDKFLSYNNKEIY